MHTRGKKNPDYELIKERNGPFAGKRVNHPVANYDECHTLAKNYLEAHLGKNASESLRYLIGLLYKCDCFTGSSNETPPGKVRETKHQPSRVSCSQQGSCRSISLHFQ